MAALDGKVSMYSVLGHAPHLSIDELSRNQTKRTRMAQRQFGRGVPFDNEDD